MHGGERTLGFIDADEVDVALLLAPVPDRFVTTAVAGEEIVLKAPTGHCLARQATVRIHDLEGAPLVHFAPGNGLSGWLDRALAGAGVRPEPAMATSVTTAAPQLAAAGLGVAVSPVSAVSAGFPGAVRPFSPRWVRELVAVTPTAPDSLAARFIDDLRARGMRVLSDVRSQLAAEDAPAGTAQAPA